MTFNNDLCWGSEMGIDPRIADLRSGSQTGTTTPDLDRAEVEEPAEGENEEGEEPEGEKN